MSNKKDLEYLQNQLGVRDSMILNRLIDNHLEKIYRLQQRIDKANVEIKKILEMAKDYEEVNLVDRLEIILKTLRGKDEFKKSN